MHCACSVRSCPYAPLVSDTIAPEAATSGSAAAVPPIAPLAPTLSSSTLPPGGTVHATPSQHVPMDLVSIDGFEGALGGVPKIPTSAGLPVSQHATLSAVAPTVPHLLSDDDDDGVDGGDQGGFTSSQIAFISQIFHGETVARRMRTTCIGLSQFSLRFYNELFEFRLSLFSLLSGREMEAYLASIDDCRIMKGQTGG